MQTQTFSLPRDDRRFLYDACGLLKNSLLQNPFAGFTIVINRAHSTLPLLLRSGKSRIYIPSFVFFPHTIPILWLGLHEELACVQENIRTERNLMPTEFPLLEKGRQVQVSDDDSIGNHAATLWPGIDHFYFELVVATKIQQ